ncbi:hypothetical protein LEP1GSC021_3987 [Leptospira noguchii str. 1993005606]|uniref:Uncharacterized protein n=2 Tax=Leptospira noguchii TaxID=28182 RepID=M6YVS2_9LEPT|nr:hypothetical protein [Leptospira noguchii]EMN01313.1 hypothetical protein LEP1GSC035_1999 [Leptospira noguchii str. 2007001578]EMO90463.1 hypothetical protein LEP1GSC024_2232 [Leptospira noguchii str. 2001034031]EMO90967.1 hypothetical protein LEP1GSC024_5011 [Leptospira noguchii str. 2001034031]EPE86602.1 hypothetical protein LEP1GSC021_3987 [Leptospira noguchii str. 1993005606]
MKFASDSPQFSYVELTLKLYTPVLNYYFGITSKEDQELLKSFLANTNGNFLKWALKSILKWDN